MRARQKTTFRPLMQRLDRLYAGYTNDQLQLLTDGLAAIATAQKQATAEITGADSP